MTEKEVEKNLTGTSATLQCNATFSRLSHDIRTPMNAVIGMLDLLLNTDLTAEQRSFATTAQANAEDLLLYLNAHLDATMAQTGAADLPSTAVPLAIARILYVDNNPASRALLEQHFARHGMRADRFDTAAEALSALESAAIHDPYRIVILDHQMPGIDGETLGTAIKSDPAYRHVMVAIVTTQTRTTDAARFAEAGFSAFLSRPLLPETLETTLTTLCNASRSGQAAPFMFVNCDVQPAALSGKMAERQAYAGYRILVVDDNTVNQQVARHIFEKLGCNVDVVGSGAAAIALHASNAYDLLMMDCHMPDMDGYQTTALIRAAEAGAPGRTPIVAWTTQTHAGEKTKCLEAGMDDFMTKPLRQKDARQMLERWLQRLPASDGESGTQELGDELEMVQDMFGDDFVELASLFRADSPKRIMGMRRAANAGDATEVARLAHALSGSTSSIGATGLAKLCKTLELRSKNDGLDDINLQLDAIAQEYAQIDLKLQSMVASFT